MGGVPREVGGDEPVLRESWCQSLAPELALRGNRVDRVEGKQVVVPSAVLGLEVVAHRCLRRPPRGSGDWALCELQQTPSPGPGIHCRTAIPLNVSFQNLHGEFAGERGLDRIEKRFLRSEGAPLRNLHHLWLINKNTVLTVCSQGPQGHLEHCDLAQREAAAAPVPAKPLAALTAL